MKNMKRFDRIPQFLVLFIVLLFGNEIRTVAAQESTPKLFAPGVISGPADDLSPAFEPPIGGLVYFTRSNGANSMILVSAFADERWIKPGIAPFSGRWNDMEPAISPDGSILVFASNRPVDSSGKVLDGSYNGKKIAGGGGNLWLVRRIMRGSSSWWSEPERLPASINQDENTFSPSIARDHSIYFMRADRTTGNFHLFRSQFQAGTYLEPLRLPIGDASTEDVDPAVAPDESFLIYSSNHPLEKQPKRLHIVFRQGARWASPQDLGDEVNGKGSNIEARLSPDGKTLYFSTNTVPPSDVPRSQQLAKRDISEMLSWANGRHNIWYVDVQKLRLSQ